MSNWRRNLLIGLSGFIIGAIATGATDTAVESYGRFRARKALISAFTGDVTAIKNAEKRLAETWDDDMEALRTVANAKKQEGGRRWLMVENLLPTGHVIFESNASRLGTLNHPLPGLIAEFYSISERLRAEMKLLASDPMLDSNKIERDRTIDEHYKTRKYLRASADALLKELRKSREIWWIECK